MTDHRSRAGPNDEPLDELLDELAAHRAPADLGARILAALPDAPSAWWQRLPAPLNASPWRPAIAALVPLVLGITLGASQTVQTLIDPDADGAGSYALPAYANVLPELDALVEEYDDAQ